MHPQSPSFSIHYTAPSRNPSTALSQALQSRGLVDPFKIIPVKKERWQLEEEWRLKAEREARGEPEPEVPDPFTITVIDPTTKKEIEVDLNKSQTFYSHVCFITATTSYKR